jgi:hypothetical protein
VVPSSSSGGSIGLEGSLRCTPFADPAAPLLAAQCCAAQERGAPLACHRRSAPVPCSRAPCAPPAVSCWTAVPPPLCRPLLPLFTQLRQNACVGVRVQAGVLAGDLKDYWQTHFHEAEGDDDDYDDDY